MHAVRILERTCVVRNTYWHLPTDGYAAEIEWVAKKGLKVCYVVMKYVLKHVLTLLHKYVIMYCTVQFNTNYYPMYLIGTKVYVRVLAKQW